MIVKCKIIDKEWAARVGDDNVVNLDINKARILENKKLVEIIDQHFEVHTAVVNRYKTKVMEPVAATTYTTKSAFDKKKINVAWLMDYSKPEGGAELSNRTVCATGALLGFDIVDVTPQNFNIGILKSADIIVVNNCFEFHRQQMGMIYDTIYERRVPYIKYEHDYREVQKRADKARQMFTMSRLNVFISPDHMEKHIQVIGEQIRGHSVCLPVAIDTKLYKNQAGARILGSLLIPRPEKCSVSLREDLEYLRGFEKVTYIGSNSFVLSGVKIEYIAKQPYEKMVELYNTHEKMYHKPDQPWAGERIYYEALLCGCKPVVNNNVGHVSWGEQVPDLEGAIYKFWREVERVLS